jgi:hypothetical protein
MTEEVVLLGKPMSVLINSMENIFSKNSGGDVLLMMGGTNEHSYCRRFSWGDPMNLVGRTPYTVDMTELGKQINC